MKRLLGVLAVVALILTSCSQHTAASWQEQYDLGVRYLGEGNYEEAVIAFTAAIGIDPAQPDIYLGRAEVYVKMSEYALALEDCEAAIALDNGDTSIYARAADLCISMGNKSGAVKFLQDGLKKTDSNDIRKDLNELVQSLLYEVLDTNSEYTVSSEPFLTSVGTDLYPFTDSIRGFVNGTVADVDMDDQPELLSLYFENEKLLLKKYEITDAGEIDESVFDLLPKLAYCDQMDVMLYYSQSLDCWCVAVSDISVGAYTGVQALDLWLYTIGQDDISQYRSWDWNNLVYGWDMLDSIQAELEGVDWPYMDNQYISVQSETSIESCVWLMRTEIEITDGMTPMEFTRYMRFLSPDELEDLP